MNADYFVFATSKKLISVWPPVAFVDLGGQIAFTNLSSDTIQVEQINNLVTQPVLPIPAGQSAAYTVKNTAPKGGHAFKVKVKMDAQERGEDVQQYSAADDPEIIIT